MSDIIHLLPDHIANQIAAGEVIGVQGGEQQVAHSAHRGNQEGNAITADNRGGVCQQVLISVGAELSREETITVANQDLFIRKGRHNQKDKRSHCANAEKGQQDIGENLEAFSFFYHFLLPPS